MSGARHPPFPRPSFGAVGILRVLVVGAIVAPLLLGAVGAYYSYLAAYERATTALAEAAAVAEQNTTKVLDTHLLVAARITDALAGLSDTEIRDQEQALHKRIADQIRDLPQVAAAWAIDTSGRALVSARVYPVNRDLDHSGRDDFQALAGGLPSFVWALRARNLQDGEYQAYFTVSTRRETSDGRFAGIVVVALSSDYFASFYNSLLGNSTQYTASVVREDGSILARYPETATSLFSGKPHDELLARAMSHGVTGGISRKGSPLSEDGSAIAYKRLANYPVYVAVGRTQASILHQWFNSVLGYIAVGIPAALGFVVLSLVALRRTQREQRALAHANEAMHQRSEIEAQLHETQREQMVQLAAANEQLKDAVEQLKAAKIAAEAASKAKSDFLANMSHELRTPLNAVIGFSELMRGETLGPLGNPAYREYAADIHFSGTHLLAIMDTILDVVRHEANRVVLKEQVIPVEELIDEALRLIRAQAMQGQVHLTWRPAPLPLPSLYCDRVRVRQMLLNLLSNAVKFTEPGGAVEVTVEVRDELDITIRDNGIGIKPEDMARIMTPFGQIEPVYARKHQGAGLGLTLTKALIERHGGRLNLYSAYGLGTAVRLSFPAERVRQAASDKAVGGAAD